MLIIKKINLFIMNHKNWYRIFKADIQINQRSHKISVQWAQFYNDKMILIDKIDKIDKIQENL